MDFSIYTLELLSALAAVPILIFLALWLGRVLSRRTGVALRLRFKICAMALAAYVPLQFYQWFMGVRLAALMTHSGAGEVRVEGAPAPIKPVLFPDWILQGLLAIGIVFGALLAVGLVRRYFWDGWFERTQETKAPRFISDIGGVFIVGVAVLVVAKLVFRFDLSVLQLGSTVSVAVIGFASQDLLGNLLSGMALQIGSPFKPGDWLMLDGRRLQVLEVNWRATRMRSPDNVLVEVPNKTIAGGMITNLSAPTRERATSFVVGIEYGADPERVKACLKSAAVRVVGVLTEPPPKAVLKDFGDFAVHYELSFWVAAEEVLVDISDAVKSNVWNDLAKAGFEMPNPPRAIYVEKAAARSSDPVRQSQTG